MILVRPIFVTLLLLIFFSFGCVMKDSVKVNRANPNEDKAEQSKVQFTGASIVNNQLVIFGHNLQKVTQVRLSGNGLSQEPFAIESKSGNTIVANGIRSLSLLVDGVYSLLLASAEGAATYQVSFDLSGVIGTSYNTTVKIPYFNASQKMVIGSAAKLQFSEATNTFNIYNDNALRIENNASVGVPLLTLESDGDVTLAKDLTVSGSSLTVNGSSVCLQNGTNCPAMGGGSFSSDLISNTSTIVIRSDSDSTGDGRITFQIGGQERMRIDNSGNLAVGTASSQARVHVSDASNVHFQAERYSADTLGPIFNFSKGRGTTSTPSAVNDNDIVGDLNFWAYGRNNADTANGEVLLARIRSEVDGKDVQARLGGALVFETGPGVSATTTEKMRIQADGNVGIGTPIPSTKLDVVGTVKATSFSGDGSALTNIAAAGASSTSGVVFTSNSDSAGADGGFTFNTATSTAMTLTNSGYLGLGTNTPTSTLDVYRASLAGFNGYLSYIHTPSMDNLGSDPTLLNVSTSFGGTPRGHLMKVNNSLYSLELTNSMQNFATISRGSAYSTFVPGGATSETSLLRLNLKDAIFDGWTPVSALPIRIDVSSWSGGTPGYRTIYGAPVKISSSDPGFDFYGFYADVTGATSSWAFYAAAGKSYFPQVTIGATTGTNALDVLGNFSASKVMLGVTTSTNQLQIGNSGHNNYGIASITNNYGAVIETGESSSPVTGAALWARNRNNNGVANEILYARNDGYVGVGTTTPAANLHVIGTIMPSNLIKFPYGSTGIGFSYADFDSNAYHFITKPDNGSGPLIFRANYSTWPSAWKNFEFQGHGNNAIMTMLNNGYVGIGNTAPDSKLTIGASLGTNYAISASSTGAFGQVLQTYEAASTDNPALWVRTATSTAGAKTLFRVQNNGIVGVGLSSPTARFHIGPVGSGVYTMIIDSEGNSNEALVFRTQGTNKWKLRSGIQNFSDFIIEREGAESTDNIYFSSTWKINIGANTAGAEKLEVVGNIKTSGCLYYASSSLGACASDARLKKEVHPFTLGLDEVLGLRPVHFKYNGLAGMGADDKEQLGVIAQEVERVAPKLVLTRKLKLHPEDKAETEVKAVDYGSFTYLLINAIKELHAKFMKLFESDSQQTREIASLKAENEWIKAENEQIKARLDRMEKLLEQRPSPVK